MMSPVKYARILLSIIHTDHTWEEFKAALNPAGFTPGWEKDTLGRYRYVQADGTYAVNKWYAD